MSVDYCVQLKDETAEHKIYPRTLAHCVLDDDGKTILELMKELLGDTSLAFNELVQEANQTAVSPTVFSELISLLSETLIRVFYSDTRPANPDLGEMWYNTSENKLYQFTAEGYVVRDTIDLRDALKVINPHFYRELINIHISDRSPTHNIGDLWVTDTIKQSRIDTTLGPGWYSVDDYHFGRSNLLRYTKEYDPAKYSKWVDKSQSTSTSAVYQTLYDFGVQRIEQRDQAVAQSVKLEPGKYYCMSAYVKSESALKPATLKPVIDETYGTIEMSNFVRDSQLSTEYTRVYFVFRTYSTCTYMMPRFSSNLDNPYLIYGLQLERGTEPTDWNPNPLDVLDKIKEYRLVCQEQRDLYYKNIPISEDIGDLAYDVENSKIYEYVYNWKDITSNNLISAFEYLNANEEYEKITAYARVEAPSTHNDGDLWLKIDTGDLYQWSDKDDIWVTANTEILPTIMTKIRTALKTTSEMEGLLDDMDKVIVEKVTETLSEIGSDYILDAVRESSLYKDPETGKTLMERMKSAESQITADAITNTVKDKLKYDETIDGLTTELDRIATQEITADAIMQKVSSHETYKADVASKNKTYSQSAEPTSGMVEGDLWIDIDDGNKLYRYDAETQKWVSVRDTTIAAARELAEQALNAAGEGITTYYGEENPTDPAEGSLWVRNAAGVKGIWRYDGTQWVNLQDDVLYDAMQAAGDAKAIADKKIITFCQDESPTNSNDTALSVGDLWIDTNDKNKMYRYDGSKWVDVQDKHLDDALYNEKTGILSRLTSAEQKIEDDKIIQLVQEKITYLDKLSSMVSSVQIEYYLADPSYTPTGNETSGWSTQVTWSDDKYVWSRTVTTLTSGSKTYSKPTCISGVQDIPDGLTIKSIEPQYCSHTSETEAPPQDHTGWVDSSDTSGTETGGDSSAKMYTWSRSKITYSDNSVAYSNPYYDVSLNRLSNVEETYATQITQLSDSIESKVSKGDLDTMMKLEIDGLHLKSSKSTNEVVIDNDSVDIRTGGETYSSFGTGYVQFGNYTIREGKDGGLVFVYDEKEK